MCLFRCDRFRVFFLLLFRVFIWSALNLNILFQLCRTKEALKKRIQQRLPKPRPKKTMPPSQNPPRRSKILKHYNTQLHTMVQANIYTKKHIYFYVEVLNFTYHLQIHSQKEFFLPIGFIVSYIICRATSVEPKHHIQPAAEVTKGPLIFPKLSLIVFLLLWLCLHSAIVNSFFAC